MLGGVVWWFEVGLGVGSLVKHADGEHGGLSQIDYLRGCEI